MAALAASTQISAPLACASRQPASRPVAAAACLRLGMAKRAVGVAQLQLAAEARRTAARVVW